MSNKLEGWRARSQVTTSEVPSHELASFPAPSDSGPSDLAEITAIEDQISTYRSVTSQISTLQGKTLTQAASSDTLIAENNAQLEILTAQARDLQLQIRRAIQGLHARARSGNLQSSKIQHANRVQEKFKAAIQDFQLSERQYRQRYAQRIEHQFKIVKPDATPEEVRAVVDDPQGGDQIFARAIATSSSERYGEARVAQREVKERHVEIQRIEAQLAELGQLFNDMAILIDEQNEQIDHAQKSAEDAFKNLEAGDDQLDTARKSAAAARRKRWWCFWICLLIISILAIAIAVPLARR